MSDDNRSPDSVPAEPSTGSIRAILFDIGDTLVHAARPGTPVGDLRVEPIGDVVAELAELGATYRLGAVTDTSVMTSADVRRALAGAGIGDRLEVVVSSVDVGAAKPDPRGLVAAMEALGVTAAETLFVGDAEVDRGAAAAAGVTFVEAGGGRSPGPAVRAALAAADRPADLR
ncbi:MAG: HAD family hydrolase [Actinomycetota bacterium]